MDAFAAQSNLLKAMAHSTRLAILDELRDGEQCVCHMEAALNLRQAYISQHLMILREAKLVESRRDGLNLFYRVVKPEVFTVLDSLVSVIQTRPKPPKHKPASAVCPCPKCKGEFSSRPLKKGNSEEKQK